MRSCTSAPRVVLAVLLAMPAGFGIAAPGDVSDPRSRYTAIRGREDLVRRDMDAQPARSEPGHTVHRVRQVIAEYERMARAFPASGYSDNALWQAARLSADAFWAWGGETDRKAALRLFSALQSHFPTSSLNREVASQTKRLTAVPTAADKTLAASEPVSAPPMVFSMLKSIRREALPGALRVILELEREAGFQDERLPDPERVFIDLRRTNVAAGLKDAVLGFGDDVVKQVRVGRQDGNVTRVVLDLQTNAARHSVYALYNPYRVVIDVERLAPGPMSKSTPAVAALPVPLEPSAKPLTAATPVAPPPAVSIVAEVKSAALVDTKITKDSPGASWTAEPLQARAVAASPPAAAPAAPAANLNGSFSLSRQLGLGISRIVIDAGHGGHDPGARVKGLNEAELVLDVALRLEKLLLAQPGVEVVLSRRSNVYVPLEERTAIANRAGADLFLSIHANASNNARARGIEMYFLNFAPNPEAEAIAARENAGASKTMHHLPDIVKAIALNNKIDESRDFASIMQTSMFDRLKRVNRETKNLGVKQAPFMVLIGATMPSVLAEISFLTNREEGALLKTANYRQQIADALFNGVMRYQKAQKATQAVAAR